MDVETNLSAPKSLLSGMPPEQNRTSWGVAALADGLVLYQCIPLFRRREQRHWELQYLRGLLLALKQRSVTPLALALEGSHVPAREQFTSGSTWDQAALPAARPTGGIAGPSGQVIAGRTAAQTMGSGAAS
jgi:hypothetical protein